jgi:hypothetical protein
MRVLGIDPGVSGAVVFINVNGDAAAHSSPRSKFHLPESRQNDASM